MAEYTFQYSADIPLTWVEHNVKDLVFPDITKKGDRIQKDFQGVLASASSVPVGMVLGLKDKEKKHFRIMSLKVKPDHQNNGIGIRLVKALEDSLKKEGVAQLELQYRSHWKTKDTLVRLLKKLNWNEPRFTLRICQSLIEQAFPVFHSRHNLPEHYEFTKWGDVTEDEKEQIREKHASGPWYPEDVSPFILEHMIEQDVSIALRYKGEIIGWLIIHKITPETLEYTSLFIDDEHRNFKMGHLLMGEGIDWQAAQEKYPKYLFTVKAENKMMVRFIERNGPVNGMIVTDVFEVTKEM